MGPDVIILTLICLLPAMDGGVVKRSDQFMELSRDEPGSPSCTAVMADGRLRVDCSDRLLSDLPEGIPEQVQVLDLSSNNFVLYPPQLERYTNLEELDMSCNHLSKPLPAYMANWPNFHTLNLKCNNYTSWISTGHSFSIKTLDLSNNKIDTVDEEAIAEMKLLSNLNLSENRLNSLSTRLFEKAENLETVILNRNYFSDMPRFQAPYLKHLFLSNCQITDLNIDSLLGMHSLLQIDLSMNLFDDIPDNLASETLQELDLSYNEIGTLTDNTFPSLPNLEVLNLRGNEFREVWPISRFELNQKLREIYVKGNRWSCEGFSVNLLLTYEFLTKEPAKVGDAGSLICYSPSNVTQMSWEQAYVQTWHSRENGVGSFTVGAILIGVIIGVLLTSLVCRGLMALNKPDPPRAAETTALNLNGTATQPRAESVVLRVPLHDEDLPPSYDEALLMPRLSSFHSLPDFVDEDIGSRRNYRRSRSIGDLTEHRPRVGDRRSVRRTVEIHINSS